MGAITVTVEPHPPLTVFTVGGTVNVDELLANFRDFLEGEPTRLALWDFSGGTLAVMPDTLMSSITAMGMHAAPRRQGARTAFVCPRTADFATVAMFISLAELTEYPVTMRVFRDMASARAWLHGK